MKIKRNKYSNTKIVMDGIKFDSKKEARRYNELKLLEKNKQIIDLELQVKYPLQPSFKYNGQTIRAMSYIADFQYIDASSGLLVVEDVKGFETPVYKIKKKLFLYKYGSEVSFYEIK